MKINNNIFLSYLYCKYKAYLISKDERLEMSDYALLQSQLQQEYKFIAASAILRQNEYFLGSQDPNPTLLDLKKGHPFVFDFVIEQPFTIFQFDALKQVNGQSSLGSFYYVPILFYAGDTIPIQQKILLSFGGIVLEEFQGKYPSFGIIVYGKNLKTLNIKLDEYRLKAQSYIDEIFPLLSCETNPNLILNKHCHICQFKTFCFDKAKKEDSLSLLSGIRENDIKRLNRKGIFTINQLSYTFRPRRRNKRVKTQSNSYYFSLQALAIREQKVYIFKRPDIPMPMPNTYIFVDMEGDANCSFVYLIGVLVVEKSRQMSFSFWADTSSMEKDIFTKFIELLENFDNNSQLFYYGSYESRVFKRMLPLIPNNAVKNLILDRSTNVLSLIYSHIYFPTYSNELKEIGKYLGFTWSHPHSSGLQSIAWRRQWENSNDITLKNILTCYNQEDCIALKIITEFIYEISCSDSFNTKLPSPEKIALVDEIKIDDEIKREWGKTDSAIEGYEKIIKCAYFDYQRNKVYVRTNDNFHKINQKIEKRKRRENKTKANYRINETVEFKSYKCPHCNSKNIYRDCYNYHAKDSLDLRFYTGGIKRWITRYRTAFHRCLDCAKNFLPPKYKKQEIVGHNLMAWAMQQHVSNRVTFEQVARTAQDCLGLPINTKQVHSFKSALAEYYKTTYKQLLDKLISGKIIHADETTVKLQKDNGYVWVFTSMEEVIYLYKPTRNAEFLHNLLRGFKGVVVTDFFTGYDSLECPQQKCLIHLIRDINDTLLKNPFDNDINRIGIEFGGLLRSIVETIDKFGLKSRHLRKHKKEVEECLNKLSKETFNSDIAEKLRKRITKYRVKLFLFLDYDGVPWNNNNAEHAIKAFAKYRRLVNGQITEQGLSDYLVLLSLYETCEYRGISFLDFLLSKERDIDKFFQKY